ncbi:YcxB family protein [Nocardia higoensis]|uniref:YcxB family protein n=1 Tax=Nocardia higoensis TaxID=228599 RepID=UPI0005927A99|nr:YcxB family protein [Nocardia higoensis]
MQISMWVPYDEGRLRRTLTFLSRSQLRVLRALGVLGALFGLFLVVRTPASPPAYLMVAIGLFLVFGMQPLAVAWSIRGQAQAVKDSQHMTLDEEWLTVITSLTETRLRWAGINRIVETPEVWYAMYGKYQAVAIPKETMTEQERATFTAFVAALPAGGRPGHGNVDRTAEST